MREVSEMQIARLLLVADGMATLLNALKQEPYIHIKYGSLIAESLQNWTNEYPAEYTCPLKDPIIQMSRTTETLDITEEILLHLNKEGKDYPANIARTFNLSSGRTHYLLERGPFLRSGKFYYAERASKYWNNSQEPKTGYPDAA